MSIVQTIVFADERRPIVVTGSRCADAGRLENHLREEEAMYREWHHLEKQTDRAQTFEALISEPQAFLFGYVPICNDYQLQKKPP